MMFALFSFKYLEGLRFYQEAWKFLIVLQKALLCNEPYYQLPNVLVYVLVINFLS